MYWDLKTYPPMNKSYEHLFKHQKTFPLFCINERVKLRLMVSLIFSHLKMCSTSMSFNCLIVPSDVLSRLKGITIFNKFL